MTNTILVPLSTNEHFPQTLVMSLSDFSQSHKEYNRDRSEKKKFLENL